MGNRSFFYQVIYLLILFAPVFAVAQSEQLTNGGFESGALSPWLNDGAAPGAITDTQAHTGSYSLRIGGYTFSKVEQALSSPVVSDGPFSFWVLVPSVIDLCDMGETCSLVFSMSIHYSGSEENHSLTGQLTGSGWKQIEIPVDSSKEILKITFLTAEINDLYIDDVSLTGSALPVPPEQVGNGDFESGSLSQWANIGAAPGTVTDTQAHTGSYSMGIGGYTFCMIGQEFSPPVVSAGPLSLWVLVPAVIDPCEIWEFCTPGFSVSLQYSGSEENRSLTGQLTGNGWKQIDIPVDPSKELLKITFSTAEISNFYIDDVSVRGTTSPPNMSWMPLLLFNE